MLYLHFPKHSNFFGNTFVCYSLSSFCSSHCMSKVPCYQKLKIAKASISAIIIVGQMGHKFIFWYPRIHTNESDKLRRGSAAAWNKTKILHTMVSCQEGWRSVGRGETARDAIPPETSNKTMKLLIRPQSSCQLQHEITKYTKDSHCGIPREVQHPLQRK